MPTRIIRECDVCHATAEQEPDGARGIPPIPEGWAWLELPERVVPSYADTGWSLKGRGITVCPTCGPRVRKAVEEAGRLFTAILQQLLASAGDGAKSGA